MACTVIQNLFVLLTIDVGEGTSCNAGCLYSQLVITCVHSIIRSYLCGLAKVPHLLGRVIQQAHHNPGHYQLIQSHCNVDCVMYNVVVCFAFQQEANYSHNEIEVLGNFSHHKSLTTLKVACILNCSEYILMYTCANLPHGLNT